MTSAAPKADCTLSFRDQRIAAQAAEALLLSREVARLVALQAFHAAYESRLRGQIADSRQRLSMDLLQIDLAACTCSDWCGTASSGAAKRITPHVEAALPAPPTMPKKDFALKHPQLFVQQRRSVQPAQLARPVAPPTARHHPYARENAPSPSGKKP